MLVIPYAFIFGAIRGIPFWWRLIDCSFAVFGIIPVWLRKSWADELEAGDSKSAERDAAEAETRVIAAQ